MYSETIQISFSAIGFCSVGVLVPDLFWCLWVCVLLHLFVLVFSLLTVFLFNFCFWFSLSCYSVPFVTCSVVITFVLTLFAGHHTVSFVHVWKVNVCSSYSLGFLYILFFSQFNRGK